MGLGLQRVVDGIVDRIDRARLRDVGRARHREVGVAASLAQNGELVIDATISAVGPGVVERPVAVNEGVGDAAVAAACEEPVPRIQQFLERGERAAEVLARVVVVMEMDFDLAEASGDQAC